MNTNQSKDLADIAGHFPGVVVPLGDDRARPHWHLYHAPASICSQKVRAAFAATSQSYVSHSLDLWVGDSYYPAYVRTRLHACAAAGFDLVDDHTGSTSVKAHGCDPCVVPTVVDEQTEEVIVDSHHICLELDRRNPSAPSALVPDELRSAIEAEMAIVDEMPNYQVGVLHWTSSSDAPITELMMRVVSRCDELMEKHKDDPFLVHGYLAKQRKERAAAQKLFAQEELAKARSESLAVLAQLDDRLRRSAGPYLFGERFTMADLIWGVELVRAEDTGLSEIWDGTQLTQLAAYYARLCDHVAIRHSLLEAPGARLWQR